VQSKINLLGESLCRDEALRRCLTERGYPIRALRSWSDLPAGEPGVGSEPVVLLFDIDVEENIGNQLNEMKRKHPGCFLLAVSTGNYHPELAEAIGKHLFALLVRPIDWDELFYLLNGIER